MDGLAQERRNSSALAMELRLSCTCIYIHIDGFVQERCNSSALAMELRLSYINPSIWHFEIEVAQVFDGNPIYSVHCQIHGCYWCVNVRSQGISSYGIDLVILGYLSLSTWWVKNYDYVDMNHWFSKKPSCCQAFHFFFSNFVEYLRWTWCIMIMLIWTIGFQKNHHAAKLSTSFSQILLNIFVELDAYAIWHYTWENNSYNYCMCWVCLLVTDVLVPILKQKHHFDEIFITGCTGSCHIDNFQPMMKMSSKWHFCFNVFGVRTSVPSLLTTRNLYDLIIYQSTATQCVCTQPRALVQSIFIAILLLTLICHYRLIH